MTPSRRIVKDLISNAGVFAIFVSVVSTLYFLVYGNTEPLLLGLVVPFFCMYALRRRVKNIYYFSVCHLVLGVGTWWILATGTARWFVLTFLLVSIMLSMYLKTREEIILGVPFAIGAAATTLLMFILLIFSIPEVPRDGIELQLNITAVVHILLLILYVHMDNIDYRLNILTRRGNSAIGNVLAGNNKIIMAVSAWVVGLTVVVLFATGLLGAIREGIGRLQQMWSNLIGHFARGMEQVHGDFEIDARNMVAEELQILEQDWVNIFEEYVVNDPERLYSDIGFNIFIMVVLTAFAVGLLVYFIKKFAARKDKNDNNLSTDEITVLTPTAISDLLNMLPRFKPKLSKIRRAYRKKVNYHIKHGAPITKTDTTNIIEQKIQKIQEIADLTHQYEKARYGK